ncbi:MAG: hydroxyacid dehydrogenase, partial [Anaerolineae bacterium]|nr:hydroxyacid dehydrogenase [Anaerolineae bacterium]
MRPRVWVERKLDPEVLARLAMEVEAITETSMGNLPGCHAAIISSRPIADGAFMDRAGPTLRVIARTGVGVDNVDIPAATERGILVVNTPDAPTESTAEHTVA